MKENKLFVKTIFFIFLPALSLLFIMLFGEPIADFLAVLIPGGYHYENADRISLVILATFYLATILYIFTFIRRKFDKLIILPISFAFTVVSAYLLDDLIPSFLISASDIIVPLYTLPFTAITIIAVIVIKIRNARTQT